MADEPTQTTTPDLTPALNEPSLVAAAGAKTETTAPEMPAGFEGGAEAWGKLDDAGKTAAHTAASDRGKADSTARVETFTKAEGKDARLAAYQALTPEEKAAAFKGLKPEDAAALGIVDPAIPQYGDFKFPDGVAVDKEGLAAFTTLAQDARIPQEQAQKFIDLALAREQAAREASLTLFRDTQTKWQGQIKADREVGGANYEASAAHVARAIDRLGVPGLREAMNLTGAGNHPAVFKALTRLGQMMAEDKFTPASGGEKTPELTLAERLYGGNGPKGSAAET